MHSNSCPPLLEGEERVIDFITEVREGLCIRFPLEYLQVPVHETSIGGWKEYVSGRLGCYSDVFMRVSCRRHYRGEYAGESTTAAKEDAL